MSYDDWKAREPIAYEDPPCADCGDDGETFTLFRDPTPRCWRCSERAEFKATTATEMAAAMFTTSREDERHE